MKTTTDFAKAVEKFLLEYLPFDRNYSKNTISSYKDGIKLFVRFMVKEKKYKLDNITLKLIDRKLVLEYLTYIRKTCSISTSNQRLSCLKSFLSYCQFDTIELLATLQSVNTIKVTKNEKKVFEIIDEETTRNLINMPDCRTIMGLKHKTILSFLYDTACRAQELCDLRIKDINFGQHSNVYIRGKGNKDRVIPISNELSDLLKAYIDKTFVSNAPADSFVFLNKDGNKFHTDGIDYILKKYYSMIDKKQEIRLPNTIHPHTIRHTRASHLIAAGVPPVYVRDFLGHEDLKTTQIYVKLDQRLKEETINKLVPKIVKNNDLNSADWRNDKDLMDFLNELK